MPSWFKIVIGYMNIPEGRNFIPLPFAGFIKEIITILKMTAVYINLEPGVTLLRALSGSLWTS